MIETALKESFERKLCVIACLDVAQYSRHMGEDEDRALAMFQERHLLAEQIITEHQGRAFGLAGDSFMAAFDEATDALVGLLAVQREIAKINEGGDIRMDIRIGVTFGDALRDGELLFGDNVNIASRLQEYAELGGIAASDNFCIHVIGRAGFRLKELGELSLKNILRPVRAFQIIDDQGEGPRPVTRQLAQPSQREIGGTKIAVLPPIAPEGEEDVRPIMAGLSEDLIQMISRNRWLRVISHRSSVQFTNPDVSTADIAHILGAEYLVRSRMRRKGDIWKILVELTHGPTDQIVWNGDFVSPVDRLLETQDEIVELVTAKLASELNVAEQSRIHLRRVNDLVSWELVHKGNWFMARRNSGDTERAKEYYEQALARDENLPDGLVAMTWWYFWRAWRRIGHDNRADLEQCQNYCRRALRMDPMDARAHAYMGAIEILSRRPDMALGYLAEAIKLNPSLSVGHALRGSALLQNGEPSAAIEPLLHSVDLDPANLYLFHAYGELAASYYFSQQYEQAFDAAGRSLLYSPSYWYSRVLRSCAKYQLDDKDAARMEKAQLLEARPDFHAARIRAIPFAKPDYNAELEQIFHDM